jgi:hypothetical protein
MTRAAYPNTAMRTLGSDGAPAEITRATVLEIAEDGDPGDCEPLPSAYRQILALFEDGKRGLRAKDICEALGAGTESRHAEGARPP